MTFVLAKFPKIAVYLMVVMCVLYAVNLILNLWNNRNDQSKK